MRFVKFEHFRLRAVRADKRTDASLYGVINRLTHYCHIKTMFFAERKKRPLIRHGENFVTGSFQKSGGALPEYCRQSRYKEQRP